jgi:hypothetical protein
MSPTRSWGLSSFAQDESVNPGRLNLYGRNGVLALVDFAHNEAGLAGLLDVCHRLASSRGGKVRLALGTAGDRTDEILHDLGVLAGARSDDLVICEKRHYLRGRNLGEMNTIFRRAAAEGVSVDGWRIDRCPSARFGRLARSGGARWHRATSNGHPRPVGRGEAIGPHARLRTW